MKKRLLLGLTALATLALASCQKDQVINEVPQDQAIEFTTYTGRDAQTKGTAATVSQLATDGFGVYAYYTDVPFTTAFNSATSSSPMTANFMENQKVTGSANGNGSYTWSYSPVKYWPKNDSYKLHFFAYAPYDSEQTGDGATGNINSISLDFGSSKGMPTLQYTIPETVSDHKDVLFAPAHKDVTKETTTDGTVKFHFFHALSRIGFKVKASAEYSGATISVNSITLSGKFHTTGLMSLNSATGTASENNTPAVTTPNWTLSNKVQREYTVSVTTAVTAPYNAQSQQDFSEDYIMIFPETFSNTDLTITVNYTVTYSSPSLTISGNVNSTSVAFGNQNSYTFEAGKAYTFVLGIGLDEIKFSAEVESWPTAETISL